MTGQGALLAFALTLAFAGLAWWVRGVNASGALAGAIAAFAIYFGAGLGGFVTLLCVFVITWLSTRLGYERKRRMGLAERVPGRSAGQIVANLAVAAGCALGAGFGHGRSVLLLGAVAALAEAAADTASSECGEALSQRAYLVTNFRRVPLGTDGAVSLLGTLFGAIAALAVVLTGAALRLLPYSAALRVAVAAIAGMFIDSLLGATLERHRMLNNNMVNFLSTASAAVLAIILAR